MNHSFQISEADHQMLADAAHAHGQTPKDLFRAWVVAVRQAIIGETFDPEQAWFWTPEWQAKEREADADLVAGRGTFFDSVESFLADLDED